MSELKATTGPWKAVTLRHESFGASSREYTIKGPHSEFIATVWSSSEDQVFISAVHDMYDDLFRSDDLLRDALKRINLNSGLGRCIQEQLKRNEKTMKKALVEA